MLNWEFYTINTTTLLLWLFENCNHEVLVIIFALGAVCVLGLGLSLASRIICTTYTVVSTVLDIVCRAFSYFLPSLHLFLDEGSLLQTESNLLASGNELSNLLTVRSNLPRPDRDTLSPSSPDRSLTLPQSLALNPAQWSILEASRARAASSDSVFTSCMPPRPARQPQSLALNPAQWSVSEASRAGATSSDSVPTSCLPP